VDHSNYILSGTYPCGCGGHNTLDRSSDQLNYVAKQYSRDVVRESVDCRISITRSYTRKILEAGLAVLIEIFWSKQRILEVYLNIAQMGDNLFGAGAASVRYFNKPPLQLNRFEAARIAAILPNPSGYSAEHASTYVVKRQQWILGQMKQLGGLSLLQQLK
jgi:membrane peptidoglycan carboxypeptidase